MAREKTSQNVRTRRHVLALGATALVVAAVETHRERGKAAPAPPAVNAGAGAAKAGTGGRAPWMDRAQRRPIRHNFTAGGRDGDRGLVLHVQEGEGSLYEHFSAPGQRSSAHFWVSRAGEIEQYVSVHDRAWAQGSGNSAWTSVETSGFATGTLTPAQVDATARIYAWGVREHGWVLELAESPQGHGLGTHEMGGAGWGGHACPGPLRAAQREEILRRARGLTLSR